MKRFLILLLCLTMALPLIAFADGEGWYRVDSTSPKGYCYLYSKPSNKGSVSANLGKYVNGQTVYVLDYYGGQDGSSNFCYVQTQDGKTGYMHASALSRVWNGNWEDTSPGWYVVDSTSPKGYAYLYSKASDRDEISYNKGAYYNGELVYVEEYYGGQDGKYNFCRVTTQDGKSGYMHDSALRRHTGSAPEEKASGWYIVDSESPRGYAYLYSAASDRDHLSYNKGRYDNGELVYVEEYYGGQDGKTGYMHDYSLRPCDGYVSGEDADHNTGALYGLSWLSESCRGTVTGADTAVYTGPSSYYYRTASGKASVNRGSNVTVYGREGNYYLIRYNATLSGRTIIRCSLIPANRLDPWYTAPELEYAWQPIRIKSNAHLADAPDRSHGYNTIEIDREDAYALALILDDEGEPWVYFESTGWADTDFQAGWKSVRGFVPASQVEAR